MDINLYKRATYIKFADIVWSDRAAVIVLIFYNVSISHSFGKMGRR